MYEVFFEGSAARDIKRLPVGISQKLIGAVKALSNNPRPAGCRKIVGSKADWRIRVGDYRIIYEVDDKARRVKVMLVRHRRESYR